jgi:hypothetical protein
LLPSLAFLIFEVRETESSSLDHHKTVNPSLLWPVLAH